VIHLFYAWSDRGAGAVLWQILNGIAYLIAALYLLRLPVAGVVTLTLVLAFYIIVGAIFELAVFFRLRGLRGTVWFLVDGLVSLLLAGSSSFIANQFISAHWLESVCCAAASPESLCPWA
jgi:uncharacterized membrane protein HdeD (DUF308 family)